MPARDAVAVGGGIGGLAIAGALTRIGWRVTVLERADAFAPVGAGIGLEPNAVRALGWLGLGDALAARVVAQGPAGLRTAGGRWLIRTDMAAFGERFGAPVYPLHRADLHRLLLDPARGADLPTEQHVTGVRQRGVVDADVPVAVTESRGRRFGAGDDLAAVAARFAGWHDPVPRLLAATRPESVLRHDIQYLRDPLPSYVHGRVALLGDAAHAITPDIGQGAAVALEDAVVVTAALADQPDELPAALTRYDLARRERTQRLVRVSERVGRIAAGRKPVTAWLRDHLAGLIPAELFLRAMDGALSRTPPTTQPLRSSL
jgi:2-polyprenyl-6-methoxyphenol hydroxylase-like FAD-dependent oxidoreductase